MICRICGETKDLSCFSKSRYMKDGLQYYCKDCCGYKQYLRRHPCTREEYLAIRYSLTWMKLCTCCGEKKGRDSFNKNKANKDGLDYYCRDCCAFKRYLRRHPGTSKKEYLESLHSKRCACCGETKDLSCFSRNRHAKDGFMGFCRKCF